MYMKMLQCRIADAVVVCMCLCICLIVRSGGALHGISYDITYEDFHYIVSALVELTLLLFFYDRMLLLVSRFGSAHHARCRMMAVL